METLFGLVKLGIAASAFAWKPLRPIAAIWGVKPRLQASAR
jgi:hypothetical protein